MANPLRLLPVSFAALIAIGTVLLRLPVSHSRGHEIGFLESLFTATSAVCVTGLTVVDTATAWSGFGQTVILALVQLGGLGIVTLVSVAILLVSDRIGVAHTRALAAEVGTDTYSSISRLIRAIVLTTLVFEAIFALLLAFRFHYAHGYDAWSAFSHGVFHSISAWNNAGFSLNSDSMTSFASDVFVLGAVAVAVVVGGIGFPVLRGIATHRHHWSRWTLHSKLMVAGTGVLLVVGFLGFLAFEWSNPETLGALPSGDRVSGAFFMSVQPRTAGFNAVDTGALSEESIVVSIVMMFIGGGSASTAGGIKVTTFALLAYVMWAEIRGDRDVNVFHRRIPESIQRLALTVSLAGVGILTASTLALMVIGDGGLAASAFEAVSALSTVGLSSGLAGEQDGAGQLLLTALMFAGRLGPVTLATAITLRSRPNLFRYPTDQPLIG
ncbi:MAG: TrkH family potassium uptake protein [Actinomycetota bacterium]|nr:TrkH family potassium uptake protein [Actinomycetota bacterium]MDA2972529.1 TrkH family potassium uptake protein [Actinomycetota bacterium]